jgi:RNA polymerase sigma-70 factor (sigma-E family)
MRPDDLAAYEAFVRSRSRPLLRTAHLLTGDLGHAEDLLQQTLERLARHWRRLDADPDAYARRTLVNLANDRWRRLGRRVRETGPPAESVPLVRDDVAAADQRHDLVGALMRLTPRQRAVLVLRFFDDLTETDAAAALGCSVGTVKSTTSRALAQLRESAAAPELTRSPR